MNSQSSSRGLAGSQQQSVVDGLAAQHGFGRFQPGRLVGRGAGDEASRPDRVAFGFDDSGDAERRPVVGGSGGDLQVGAFLGSLRAACAPRRSARSSPARSRNSRRTGLPPRAFARPSVRRRSAWRPSAISTGGRSMCGIAVGERAADCRDIAHAHVRQRPQGVG